VSRTDTDAVLADLNERGYDVTRLDGDGPVAVAAGGEAPGAVTDRPLAVEPISRPSPLTLASYLAGAASKEQAVLFVADDRTGHRATSVLEQPFLLAAEHDGHREFYTVPDRILLQDGGYAAVRTDGSLTWREEPADGTLTDGGTDAPRLLLETEGEAVAAFDSVAALTCPGPTADAFPYRYEREGDKRVHVYDRQRDVGRYAGVAAMKANAYRPVPLPLVPEHHVRENRALARAWTVATVTDGEVTYTTATAPGR
jgi:hypothetical protein